MPIDPVLTSNGSYNRLPGDFEQGNNNNKKKQNKKRANKNGNNNSRGNNSNASQGHAQQQGKNSNRSGTAITNNSPGKKAQRQRQPEPDFSPDSFPALSDQTRKVEVVVDGTDAAEKHPGTNSDASSTATTMSSSSSSINKQQQAAQNKQPFGGYAAALLKVKPTSSPTKKVSCVITFLCEVMSCTTVLAGDSSSQLHQTQTNHLYLIL
jgi:hypothetical protein